MNTHTTDSDVRHDISDANTVVPDVPPEVSNTHSTVSGVPKESANALVVGSDDHHNTTKSPKDTDDRNMVVSATRIPLLTD